MGDRFVQESMFEATLKGWEGAYAGWCGKHRDSDKPVRECYNCNDYRSGIFDTSTDPPSLIGNDGGEPEDQTLNRDWSWVVGALNKAASGAE